MRALYRTLPVLAASFLLLAMPGCAGLPNAASPALAMTPRVLATPLVITRDGPHLRAGMILVSPETGPAVILEDGARIAGVTVRGRDRAARGAAIVARGRGIVMEDVIVEGDAAMGLLVLAGEVTWARGGVLARGDVGVMVRGGRLDLESATVTGARGGGIEVHEGAQVRLSDVAIVANGGAGLVLGALARAVLERGRIVANGGAAVERIFSHAELAISGVRIAGNARDTLEDSRVPERTAPAASEAPAAGAHDGLDPLVSRADLARALAAIDFTESDLALPTDRWSRMNPMTRRALQDPAGAPDRAANDAARLLAETAPEGFVAAVARVAAGIPDRDGDVGNARPASPAEDRLVETLLALAARCAAWPDPAPLRDALYGERADATLLETHWEAPAERAETLRLGQAADSVDPSAVAAALAELVAVATPEAFRAASGSRRLPTIGVPRPRVEGRAEVFRTKAGWIAIGDTGPNRYGAGWTAILDRGGDDEYEDAAYAENGPALVVDLAGNDVYRGRTASALRGIAVLLDHAGRDRYEGGDFAQASVSVGGALLWDFAGDDRYEAGRGSQGAAVAGLALLVDRAGSDRYEAAAQAQAHAGPGAFAALVDAAGDDRYALTGGAADLLRNPEARLSLGQAHATGFRPGAVGGCALLADGGGDDRYEAGLFAQGCGYWGGLGVLYDRGGSDARLARQYAQGSGVHGAVGILLDLGTGRDLYQAWSCAQGSGHDLALGILVDDAGNDLYRSDNLTQGSGNANGTGLLVDRAGDDVYVLEESTLGQGHGVFEDLSRRWGSLGILLDLSGRDRYSGPGRDATTWVQGDVGVGLDR